jgi:hypothetical protein
MFLIPRNYSFKNIIKTGMTVIETTPLPSPNLSLEGEIQGIKNP